MLPVNQVKTALGLTDMDGPSAAVLDKYVDTLVGGTARGAAELAAMDGRTIVRRADVAEYLTRRASSGGAAVLPLEYFGATTGRYTPSVGAEQPTTPLPDGTARQALLLQVPAGLDTTGTLGLVAGFQKGIVGGACGCTRRGAHEEEARVVSASDVGAMVRGKVRLSGGAKSLIAGYVDAVVKKFVSGVKYLRGKLTFKKLSGSAEKGSPRKSPRKTPSPSSKRRVTAGA